MNEARASAATAWRIGLAYLMLGGLWIVLSDALVLAISSDAAWVAAAQRWKGLVYVVATTLLLVWLVRGGYRRLLAARQRARSSEMRLQDMFLQHPMPMWVCELPSLRVVAVNDAALAAYGYSREQFLALSGAELHASGDAAALHAGGAGLAAGAVFRHRAQCGETLLMRITEHAVELNGRRVLIVMADNVTEEMRLQCAVRTQQEQFRQLHQSLGEVLWMATPDGRRMIYVSPAFADLYGRGVDEMMADSRLWFEAIHPDDRAQVLHIDDFAPGRQSLVCQYRIVRPDGSQRWIEDRKKTIVDDAGRVVMVGGIAEDITARKERDAALEQLAGRLESLVAERTQALEQANIELEAFTRTAAHDLKSPLNGIVGLSGLLQQKCAASLDDTGRRYAGMIERSALNMASLVDDLLALSRAGSMALEPRVVDLLPAAESLLDDLRVREPLRRVDVVLPPELPLYCDAGLLYSVLQNLLGNAWKFSAGRDVARIEVRLESGDGQQRLVVADNGQGFDSRQAPASFRPFQRFHTQAQFQGTGLGLVTCQRIAQRHGGSLHVDSAPGQGTRVTLVLPAPPAEAAAACALPQREAAIA